MLTRNLRPPPTRLTKCERVILKMIAAGQVNKEIAAALSISTETVKRHNVNLMRKLGVDSRTQAARVYYGRFIKTLQQENEAYRAAFENVDITKLNGVGVRKLYIYLRDRSDAKA